MNKRIKALRLALNLNQTKFAEKIGIKQASLSAIEKGIRSLTDRNINLICEKFGVSEEWLRFGTGEMFEELTSKLGILEISNLVSVSDVSKLIQRTEIILRHSEILKKDFVEAGKEGNLLNFRYKELIRGVEKKEEDIIRDYAKNSLKKTRIILENLTYEGLLDLDSVSRLILEKEPTDPISPRGYRFLSELDLTDKDVSLIVKAHHNLNEIISEDNNKLDVLLQNRSAQIKEEIRTLKEQIIEGRIIL